MSDSRYSPGAAGPMRKDPSGSIPARSGAPVGSERHLGVQDLPLDRGIRDTFGQREHGAREAEPGDRLSRRLRRRDDPDRRQVSLGAPSRRAQSCKSDLVERSGRGFFRARALRRVMLLCSDSTIALVFPHHLDFADSRPNPGYRSCLGKMSANR